MTRDDAPAVPTAECLVTAAVGESGRTGRRARAAAGRRTVPDRSTVRVARPDRPCRVRFAHARPSRRHARVPLRPRRRAHRHRERARRGVEADVRRLPARPRRARRHAVPCRSTSRPTTAPTSTASRGWTAPTRFLRSRGIELPEGGPGRRRRTPRRCTALSTPQERPGPGEDHDRRGGRLPGLGALPAGRAARPGWPPPSCRPRPTPSRCSTVAGLDRLHRPPRRRRDAPRSGACPASPRPDTFLAAAADLGVDRAAGGRVRGRAGRRRGRARRAGSAFVVGVDRLGQADALREHGADRRRHRPGRAAGGADVKPRSRPGRSPSSRGWCASPASTWTRSGQAESVFALSNGHIGLRGNLDEGEPHATARHLPELVLRAAAAALRRGRLRLPRVRPDDHQRHQRQADPAAGRRRAVRPALRHAAPATSGCSTCRPAR